MVRRPSRRAYIGQWVFLLAVVVIGGLLTYTLGDNLARRNMHFGFAFLANLGGHYFVGLPIAIWLGLHLGQGVMGLWWGLCAGLTAVAIALFTRFLRLSAKEITPLEAHPRVASAE